MGLVLSVIAIPKLAPAETAALKDLRVGNHGAYIRIVFELSKQVQYQLDQDAEVGQISILFLDTITSISKEFVATRSGCLAQVTMSQQNNQARVILQFSPVWNKLNPFVLREPDRMVLDVSCGENASTTSLQTSVQLDQSAPAPDTAPDEKLATTDASSTLIHPQPVETEPEATNTTETSRLESTPSSAAANEARIQELKPATNQAAEPVATTVVATRKKDPFQKLLLIVLAAITSIIIVLIALIVIQKKSQSGGSDVIRDSAYADSDETMRSIDNQIKSKLMKYDDQ